MSYELWSQMSCTDLDEGMELGHPLENHKWL